MPRYLVPLTVTTSTAFEIEVDAPDPDTAHDQVYDLIKAVGGPAQTETIPDITRLSHATSLDVGFALDT